MAAALRTHCVRGAACRFARIGGELCDNPRSIPAQRLGSLLMQTPILGLAVLADSPKAEPWRASARQGSVLGVVYKFRTPLAT